MNKADQVGELKTGLAGLIEGSIDAEVALLDDSHRYSPAMLRDLRKSLLQIYPLPGTVDQWDIKVAIQVLRAISPLVHQLMDQPLPPTPEDPELRVDLAHVTSQLVDELCVALEDLDDGKVDKRLKPGKLKRGHGIAMTRTKQEALAVLDVVAARKRDEGIIDFENQAREEVAGALSASKIRWPEGKNGEKDIDATLLDSWNKRPPIR